MLNLLASALTILTATVLLGVAALVGDSSATVVGSERDEHVIHEFYRAVNEVIRSGDATALDHIVAPDLALHTPSAQVTPNRSGLDHYLISIHDTFPLFQLRVEGLVSDGDQTVVRVDGGGETPGSFLGLTLATVPSPWGQFDSLRIADRKVVEMWSETPAPVLAELVTAVRLDLETPPQAISVEQLSAPAGQHQEWGSLFGARVLYVDEGALKVDLGSADPPTVLYTQRNGQVQRTPVAPGAQVVMKAGDVMSFSLGAQHRVWHDAADPGVMAFAVALPHVLYNGPLQRERPSAAKADTAGQSNLEAIQADLGAEQAVDPLAGVTVSLGRALLSPGAKVTFPEAEGFLLVAIESGALVLTKEHDVRLLDRRGADGRALVTLGESFALHNLGDDTASALMVTVLPRKTLDTPIPVASTWLAGARFRRSLACCPAGPRPIRAALPPASPPSCAPWPGHRRRGSACADAS